MITGRNSGCLFRKGISASVLIEVTSVVFCNLQTEWLLIRLRRNDTLFTKAISFSSKETFFVVMWITINLRMECTVNLVYRSRWRARGFRWTRWKCEDHRWRRICLEVDCSEIYCTSSEREEARRRRPWWAVIGKLWNLPNQYLVYFINRSHFLIRPPIQGTVNVANI